MSEENENALAVPGLFWLRFTINRWPDGKIQLNDNLFLLIIQGSQETT